MTDVISQIVQIIPANGWGAIYHYENHKTTMPIACWALCVVTNEVGAKTQKVRGMWGFPELEFCDENTAFKGYVNIETKHVKYD